MVLLLLEAWCRMKNKIIEITSDLVARHTGVVKQIQDFSDVIFVGRFKSGDWAKLSYSQYGMGLACFLSEKDSKDWYSVPDKQHFNLVSMLKEDAIKLAKRENVEYLHLLSNDIKSPLSHFKIS